MKRAKCEHPVLLFLDCPGFPCLFFIRNSLLSFASFPFFARVLGVRQEHNNVLGGPFPGVPAENKEWKDRAMSHALLTFPDFQQS